jgi:hypothetical protein
VFDAPAPAKGQQVVARLDRPDAQADDNQAVFPAKSPGTAVPGITAVSSRSVSTESDLRVPTSWGVPASDVSPGGPWPLAWLYLAGLVVALTAAHWCLYHRRWMS